MGVGIAFSFGIPLVTQAVIDGPLSESGPVSSQLEVAWSTAWLSSVSERFGLAREGQLGLAAGLILALATLSGACLYLRGRLSAVASEGIVLRIREAVFGHLAELPCSYHDEAETGDLVQRCTSDVETLRAFLATQVVEIGRAILLIGISAPILFQLNVPLAWLSFALMPIIVGFAFLFFRKIQTTFRRMDEAEGRMTTVLQENLTAVRVVRAFARQDFEVQKFGERNAEFRDLHTRFIRLLGVYWSTSDLLCLAQIGLVLIAGGLFASRGELTVGTLAAFLEYEIMTLWPVRQLGRVLSETGKAVVSTGRLREVLDAEPESHLDPRPGESPPPLRGALRVRDLTFSFGEGAPALAGIDFDLEAGQTLALIGPPGSGKTALVQLLLRLYDYSDGSIRIDGHELGDLPRRHVRSHFGVVLQEPFLYSKTVRANLALGSPSASEEELFESATAAAIHDAILEFDEGYETLVGERGVTLSGGQRQRLAIARALLLDSPILVLDDALSAVDTETETRILDALERRRGKRTTILIAHRLSSVVHADTLLVLDGGRIVQSGAHEELIAQPGPYRRLWEIQGALEDDLRSDLSAASDTTPAR